MVVKQGNDKRYRTLARNRRRISRTWVAGSVKVIKDISYGLSLMLGRRFQRPTISPFLIPQPRQLPQKHLSRALQIPFRVRHRWATSSSFTHYDQRTNTHSLPHCAMERVYTHRRSFAYIEFHTRLTLYLPSNVKVLFQTGNTLGFISLTEPSTPCHPFGDRKFQEPETSGMSSGRSALPQPCHFQFSKSFER